VLSVLSRKKLIMDHPR